MWYGMWYIVVLCHENSDLAHGIVSSGSNAEMGMTIISSAAVRTGHERLIDAHCVMRVVAIFTKVEMQKNMTSKRATQNPASKLRKQGAPWSHLKNIEIL